MKCQTKIAVVEQANAEAHQVANEENDNKKSADITRVLTKSVVKVITSGTFSILIIIFKK